MRHGDDSCNVELGHVAVMPSLGCNNSEQPKTGISIGFSRLKYDGLGLSRSQPRFHFHRMLPVYD